MIRRYRPRSAHLIALLLIVIAANEVQRTWAQERAHRERQEGAIRVEELNRKVDWLVTMQRPTTSGRPPTQQIPAQGGLESAK